MPAFVKVMILAVLQGLTEFLPVSSSGHLVLLKGLLNLKAPGAILEISLHAGTLVSVLVYYRSTIARLIREFFSGEGDGRTYAGYIILASVPAAAAFFLFHKRIIACFEDSRSVEVMLCITGVILLSLIFANGKDQPLNAARSFLVGMAQAVALLPGISRSGSTIVMGRHLGLSPEKAVEFSLLISLPALIGSTLLDAVKLGSVQLGDLTLTSLCCGVVVAAIVGYAAIMILVKILLAGRLWMFGLYCLAVGILGLLFKL